MISFGRWVHIGRWWIDWTEVRWALRDLRCRLFGHRSAIYLLDNGDRVRICQRCGDYQCLWTVKP